MTTGRLEAFSDGVFAVAITLLVLDIHPPTDAHGGTDLWRPLGDRLADVGSGAGDSCRTDMAVPGVGAVADRVDSRGAPQGGGAATGVGKADRPNHFVWG